MKGIVAGRILAPGRILQWRHYSFPLLSALAG